MLNLKISSIPVTFICPDCNCAFGESKDLLFQGMHVLVECICECCDHTYFHTLPNGHTHFFPIAFSSITSSVSCNDQVFGWLAKPLVDSVRKNKTIQATIERILLSSSKEVILLNCLDSCYGHVLLKLFSTHRYIQKYPSKGIIILIPASFRWLVPDGVAEIWTISTSLKNFSYKISSLDEFSKGAIEKFDSFELANVPIYPELTQDELRQYIEQKPFDLTEFENRPFTLSFILREDRFWTGSPIDEFFLRVSISLGILPLMKPYFRMRQHRNVNVLARKLIKAFSPNLILYAIGIGKEGGLIKEIQDRRTLAIVEKLEKKWCSLYASSHVVIGIHGSNMLLPTFLAAGYINILPRHKIDNFAEDVMSSHKGRYRQFLGRYVDEFDSVSLIANHIVSMYKQFPFLKKSTEQELK